MGDDILNATILFNDINVDSRFDFTDFDREVLRPIDRILKEHQYERLQPKADSSRWQYGWKMVITYRLPDSDGDPDRFHHCGLMVMFERLIWLLRDRLGPEEWSRWELSTEHRLP